MLSIAALVECSCPNEIPICSKGLPYHLPSHHMPPQSAVTSAGLNCRLECPCWQCQWRLGLVSNIFRECALDVRSALIVHFSTWLACACMQALEKISHEHPAACLRHGGLLASLTYLDFFQTGVQRVAVATAANMCRSITSENTDAVADAIPILTNLLQYQV